MVYSMTGFGRAEKVIPAGKISVELRSVNHRYLDLNFRLNHRLFVYENQIRNTLKEQIHRGKVDVTISWEINKDADVEIVYNENIAKEYLQHIQTMCSNLDLNNDISATKLANFSDVFVIKEGQITSDGMWEDIKDVLTNAIKAFLNARQEEGERLKIDLLQKLRNVSSLVEQIEEKTPALVSDYKQNLTRKVSELLGDAKLDESRLATEVVIFADKISVDEELVRLKSHIAAASQTLEKGDEVGRKLDFIAQELNREANTILSKTGDPEVSNIGIELKTLIEKIREQIQNLE